MLQLFCNVAYFVAPCSTLDSIYPCKNLTVYIYIVDYIIYIIK